MSVAELVAAFLGFVSVWLTVRENPWGWPIGILNSALFIWVFASAHLYADALLQLVYIAVGFYGWWVWLHPPDGQVEMPVTRTAAREAMICGVLGVVAAAVWGTVLARYTDQAVPYWNASTVAGSLVAQWLMTQKRLENWFVWIATDVAMIALYVYVGLYVTAALTALYMALCVKGIVDWRRSG